MKQQIKFIIISEGWLSSLMKDLFTFWGIILIFYANNNWLGGKWYIGLLGVFMLIIMISSRVSKNRKEFITKEEAKRYIDSI